MPTDSDSRRRLWPHTHPTRAAGMAVDGAMYVAADVQLIVGVEYRAAIDISDRSYAYLVAFEGPLQKQGAACAQSRRSSCFPLPFADAALSSRCDRAGDPQKRYGGSTSAFRLGCTAVGGWSGLGTLVWRHASTRLNLHPTDPLWPPHL
jgi:hypothetical protein